MLMSYIIAVIAGLGFGSSVVKAIFEKDGLVMVYSVMFLIIIIVNIFG